MLYSQFHVTFCLLFILEPESGKTRNGNHLHTYTHALSQAIVIKNNLLVVASQRPYSKLTGRMAACAIAIRFLRSAYAQNWISLHLIDPTVEAFDPPLHCALHSLVVRIPSRRGAKLVQHLLWNAAHGSPTNSCTAISPPVRRCVAAR